MFARVNIPSVEFPDFSARTVRKTARSLSQFE